MHPHPHLPIHFHPHLLFPLLLLLLFNPPATTAQNPSCVCNAILDRRYPPADTLPNPPLAAISLAGRHLPESLQGELVLAATGLALLDALQYARDANRLTDAVPDAAAARSVPWDTFVAYAAYATVRAGLQGVVGAGDAALAALDAEAAAVGLTDAAVLASAGAPFAAASFAKVVPSTPPADYAPPNAPSGSSYADCATVHRPEKWQPLRNQSVGDVVNFVNAPLFSNAFRPPTRDIFLPPPRPYNASRDSPYLTFASPFGKQYLAVLRETAALGDYDKALAEVFEPSMAFLVVRAIQAELAARPKVNARNAVVYLGGSIMAMYDASIGAGTLKLKHSSARPVSVLQCMMGPWRRRVTPVWRGPYRGVGVPGEGASTPTAEREGVWRPYLRTPANPGYVSGHSSVATAGTRAFTRLSGASTVGPNCLLHKRGGSSVEPRVRRGGEGYVEGVTDVANGGAATVGYSPAKDVRVCWGRLKWMPNLVGRSRVVGGIHTPEDVYYGNVVGHRAAVFTVQYMREEGITFAHRPKW